MRRRRRLTPRARPAALPAGLLRPSAEQWEILFNRYNMSYADAKHAAFDSIRHSFIKEPGVKRRLERQLARDFGAFEASLARRAEVLGVSGAGGGSGGLRGRL